MSSLIEFFSNLDNATEGLLEPRDTNGHYDLPGYRAYMGPRYGIPHATVPLSVFRGEGMALFALSQILQPKIVIECFTGTGYAAICLAGGWPDAEVFTVDDYREGGAPDRGWEVATVLRERMELPNLTMVRGLTGDLAKLVREAADLYLSDGPYEQAPPLSDRVVHIRHDDKMGQVDGRRFIIPGGSHMSVTCPSIEMRDWLMAEVGRIIPTEAA